MSPSTSEPALLRTFTWWPWAVPLGAHLHRRVIKDMYLCTIIAVIERVPMEAGWHFRLDRPWLVHLVRVVCEHVGRRLPAEGAGAAVVAAAPSHGRVCH
jgi:hypothetical protein